MSGFDCSGLIYYVTSGFTPRNTSSWLTWGNAVPIEGLSLDEIASLLRPLDAIVWLGHIVFVFDRLYAIESRAGRGVVFSSLKERLREILVDDKRTPKNEWSTGQPQFVIRRWHPEFQNKS